MSDSNNRMIVFASILGAILATSLLALNPSMAANASTQMYGDHQYGYDSNYYQDDNRYRYDNDQLKTFEEPEPISVEICFNGMDDDGDGDTDCEDTDGSITPEYF